MVRKRNMNKKRSQVAHYVKCELLVARRPLTIFSLSSCVRCRCLFHLFHFIRCRFEICVLYIFEIPPPKNERTHFFYLFYSVFVRSIVFFFFFSSVRSFSSLFACLFISSGLLLLLLLLLCVPVDSFVICNRERIYVARTSSHRYETECIRLYEFLPFIARMQSQWINGNICDV